jgi:hypothetical protein
MDSVHGSRVAHVRCDLDAGLVVTIMLRRGIRRLRLRGDSKGPPITGGQAQTFLTSHSGLNWLEFAGGRLLNCGILVGSRRFSDLAEPVQLEDLMGVDCRLELIF